MIEGSAMTRFEDHQAENLMGLHKVNVRLKQRRRLSGPKG